MCAWCCSVNSLLRPEIWCWVGGMKCKLRPYMATWKDLCICTVSCCVPLHVAAQSNKNKSGAHCIKSTCQTFNISLGWRPHRSSDATCSGSVVQVRPALQYQRIKNCCWTSENTLFKQMYAARDALKQQLYGLIAADTDNKVRHPAPIVHC